MFEKEYLHEAFQYTGGGLTLTALAARGLFNSGAAVRIMSANPCECRCILTKVYVATDD